MIEILIEQVSVFGMPVISRPWCHRRSRGNESISNTPIDWRKAAAHSAGEFEGEVARREVLRETVGIAKETLQLSIAPNGRRTGDVEHRSHEVCAEVHTCGRRIACHDALGS